MKLYFITNDNIDGDNIDAFVWATSPTEAVQLYLPMFEQSKLSEEAQVFEVPIIPEPEPRALEWHTDVKARIL